MRKSADPLYDEKCLHLADIFIADAYDPRRHAPRTPAKIERDKQSLASAIQEAVDDWFMAEAPEEPRQ